MNFLRRILGTPPSDEKSNNLPLPNSASVEVSTKPPVTESVNTPERQELAKAMKIADGVTRPLPPDVLLEPPVYDHLIFGQHTDIGMVRTNNQDAGFSFFATTRSSEDWPDVGIFIVADGMGGHHDGEKASAIAARTVGTRLTDTVYISLLTGDHHNQVPITESIVEAILKANSDVVSKVPDGGTTLTSVVIIGDLAYIAHVGDSRAYFLQRDRIEQLTRDHSLVQRLIELEQLTEKEAEDHPQKNVLYRALGQNEAIEVDTLTRRLTPHSRILLCSDGLWNQVADHEILEIVNSNPNPQEACKKLVTLANDRGGLDNVTVILVQLP